ncbi:hypothetical protein Tco_0670957 [Tanacetum coccineum]
MKKSCGFVKKGKRDQDSDSSDDKGNAYFGEALVVVGNDEMVELVMDSGHALSKGHTLSSFILKDVKYVPGLKRSLISLGTLKKEGYTVKMQMGRIKVSNDDGAVAQRRLGDKQPEEKTNMDCLVKVQEKVHLGIKVGANVTVTRILSQKGVEGNVAEKKKVKESMEANLGKLLKYNALSTRWSSIQGFGMRKR